MSTKSGQLEWPRAKVIELRARGMSQIEIAHELQVSKQSISSDMNYLRKQAKESIKEYATKHLPEQYQVCLTALDTTIKRAFDILEGSEDNREKMQALTLAKECYSMKLDLLTNATVVDDAIRFVSSSWKSNEQIQASSGSNNENDNEPSERDNNLIQRENQETINQVF